MSLPLIMFMGGGGFSVKGVDFDGTNDYMSRGAGWTDAVDHTDGIFSVWLRLDGGDGTVMSILDGATGNASAIWRDANNKFRMFFTNTATTATFGFTTATARTATAPASWIHLLMAWQSNSSNIQQVYINDVSDFGTNDNNLGGDLGALDYTRPDWRVGEGGLSGFPGVGKFNGCMAEYYFAPGQYLDISVTANRRKFITASGKPVNLGDDGSLPTGTSPIVYFKLASTDQQANKFRLNQGMGGDMTITGKLDLSSTNP